MMYELGSLSVSLTVLIYCLCPSESQALSFSASETTLCLQSVDFNFGMCSNAFLHSAKNPLLSQAGLESPHRGVAPSCVTV